MNFKILIDWWCSLIHTYIKDTWIGFSAINIAKQAVAYHILWLLGSWAAWNGKIACKQKTKYLKGYRHGQWSSKHTYVGGVEHKTSSHFRCSLSKQDNNMNNMEKWVIFTSSFCRSLKIEKTITYAFNNILLNWSNIKEGLRDFLFSKVVFDLHYIRMFSKFPGWFPNGWLSWFMISGAPTDPK